MKASIRGIATLYLACILLSSLFCVTSTRASEGNIDSEEKFAWAENAGWLNFRPTHAGVTVHANYLSGYAWAENIGWIKLGSGTGPYTNTDKTNWGVNRDSNSALSGYAWSENAGWINFNPPHSQVTIDATTGSFDGYAWAKNVGWIHLKYDDPSYNVALSSITPNTYYVDIKDGDNANDGLSKASAWKTLHYAIAQINSLCSLGPLDTLALYVAAGTYSVDNDESDMDVDNPLTVTQDKVTIDGADSPKPIISGLGAELWTDGIDIQASNVTIQDMEVLNFTAFSSGIKISSGLNNIIDNCRN